ncbi:MAG: diacylglycerol kinase [Gammaproteobacteria bacterium]
MANKARGLDRIIKAFGYSMQGLRAGWHHEAAFRQEVLLVGVLFPCVFWVGRSPLDYAILIASLLFVLISELFNSAIEALADRIGPEHHELSGRAKDLGSAAVFLALVLLAVIWAAYAWLRFST